MSTIEYGPYARQPGGAILFTAERRECVDASQVQSRVDLIKLALGSGAAIAVDGVIKEVVGDIDPPRLSHAMGDDAADTAEIDDEADVAAEPRATEAPTTDVVHGELIDPLNKDLVLQAPTATLGERLALLRQLDRMCERISEAQERQLANQAAQVEQAIAHSKQIAETTYMLSMYYARLYAALPSRQHELQEAVSQLERYQLMQVACRRPQLEPERSSRVWDAIIHGLAAIVEARNSGETA